MKTIVGLIFIGGILLFGSDSKAVSISLSLTPTSLSFADNDPDFFPEIPANTGIQVSVRVRENRRGRWTLTHRAATDLRSGADTIPVSSITWTASPTPPFLNGRMSALVNQKAGEGSGNVNRVGTFQFRLGNSWNFNRGNYSAVTNFTLSAP